MFKFDSNKFYLTYSQCGDLAWETIADFLKTKADIKWARFGLELHQDGGRHWHVCGEWTKRVQSRSERFLDVSGKHPNIQSTRSTAGCLSYVSKHGEFWDLGTVPTTCDSGGDWIELAASSSEAEYFSAALAARIGFQYAERFWRIGRARTTCEITDSYEADLSRECFELLVHVPAPEQATVVMGPSGCGKTSWAKRVCTKPALWVRHMDMLRAFRPGHHKAIIFDDMAFAHMPREAQIHLVDWHDEAHMHARYNVAVIPAHVQKIFTCNYYPFTEDPAITRRVYKIEVQGLSVDI